MCVNKVRFGCSRSAASIASLKLKWVGWGACRQRAENQNIEPLEQRPTLFRDPIRVGAIGDVSETKTEHTKATVLQPYRNHLRAEKFEGLRRDRVHVELGDTAAVGLDAGKGVVKRFPQSLVDMCLAVNRNRTVQTQRKQT